MKDDSPAMTDGPITQQKPAWYSRDGDPVSKGSFVNSLLEDTRAETIGDTGIAAIHR